MRDAYQVNITLLESWPAEKLNGRAWFYKETEASGVAWKGFIAIANRTVTVERKETWTFTNGGSRDSKPSYLFTSASLVAAAGTSRYDFASAIGIGPLGPVGVIYLALNAMCGQTKHCGHSDEGREKVEFHVLLVLCLSNNNHGVVKATVPFIQLFDK